MSSWKILRGTQCVKLNNVKTCPAGTILRGTQCVKFNNVKACPAGTRKVGSACVPNIKRQKVCHTIGKKRVCF